MRTFKNLLGFEFDLQMFATITANRGTANITQNKRVIDMSDTINLLEPQASPLVVLTNRLSKKSCFSPKYEWLEDEANPESVTTTTTASSGNLTIAGYAVLREDDLIHNPATGEVMLVTATPSGTTVAVTRGWGATTGTAIASGQTLWVIGSAREEGDDSRDLLSRLADAESNYTQIFRDPYEVTNTANASKMYGGNDLAYQRKKFGIEHLRQIERAFLFGTKAETAGATHKQRSTAGCVELITTNVTNVGGGGLTETKFEEWLRTVFRYGSDTRWLMASPRLISVINLWAQGKLQMVPSDKTFGISVKKYLSGHGTLNIVNHKQLQGATYGYYGIALDMEMVKSRVLEGRDTKIYRDIQLPGADTMKEEYLTEIGFQLEQERRHGIIKGFTS